MATKERYENPTVGDTVNLHLYVMNSNAPADVASVSQVEIYYLDPAARTTSNPDGRTLVETLTGVVHVATGDYNLPLYLDPALYTQYGNYLDVWYVTFEAGNPEATKEQYFVVYEDLWYTSPTPVLYDFEFYFQPNKFRLGSVKPMVVQVVPNVPRATDLQNYYQNLASNGGVLTVTIKKRCGPCTPCEEDLLTVVEDAPVEFRGTNSGYYTIDTNDYEAGIYDITFTLEFGGNTYVSPANQFQVF